MLRRLLSEGGVSLDRLASFHDVVENGSISAAARGVASRQSLISRQIGELETALGVALFQRESRPHRLSEEGEELARLCREFFSGMSDCMDRWQNVESTVTLASGESLLQWIILPLLRNRPVFKRQNIRLGLRNLRTDDSIRAVVDGRVDLALVRKDAVPRGLDHDGEFVFEYRLIVPSTLSSQIGAKASVRDLGMLPLIVLEGDGQLMNSVRSEADAAGIKLDVRLECSSYPQIAEAIDSLRWAGFLPQFAPAIKNTSQVILPELKPLSRVLTLAWSPRRWKSRPAIEKVVKGILN